jgi:hypothetical protein
MLSFPSRSSENLPDDKFCLFLVNFICKRPVSCRRVFDLVRDPSEACCHVITNMAYC